MADGAWSYGCRNDVEWYGFPGQGSYYRSLFGTYWVGGGVYQKYASLGYECYPARWEDPWLGAPVKAYGWVQEMNYGQGCYGQWFENGAIGYHDGAWRVMYGRYGQAGLVRRAVKKVQGLVARRNVEEPPDAPTSPPLLPA